MPKTVAIRSVDDATAERFARNAAARGMSQAQYLAALVEIDEFDVPPMPRKDK